MEATLQITSGAMVTLQQLAGDFHAFLLAMTFTSVLFDVIFWPYAYNHKRQHGKPEDIFATEDLAVIIKAQAKFIQKVIEKSKKTHLMSSTICDHARDHLGAKTVNDFFLNDKLFSLSQTEYVTCCHAECDIYARVTNALATIQPQYL
jgi:hypothetical protein